jgi:hypothetical protein
MDLPPRSAKPVDRDEPRRDPVEDERPAPVRAPQPKHAPHASVEKPAHHHERSVEKRSNAKPVGKPTTKKGYPKNSKVNGKPKAKASKKVRGPMAKPGKGAGHRSISR